MKIPDKVINRLSLYHFILDDINDDEKYISSSQISELLGIDNSQVRKDLTYVDNMGKCRVGYEVKTLKKKIEQCLGFKQKRNAFIIGAGNLGSALAKYDSFQDYSLNIIAMFDVDAKKIGTSVNGKEVYSMNKLQELVFDLNVDIAILTVPKEFANDTAKDLVKAGIKYIWNFTPCVLGVSKEVKVWNENLIGSFLQFTHNADET